MRFFLSECHHSRKIFLGAWRGEAIMMIGEIEYDPQSCRNRHPVMFRVTIVQIPPLPEHMQQRRPTWLQRAVHSAEGSI